MKKLNICLVDIFLLLGNNGHMEYMFVNDTVLKYRIYLIILGRLKTCMPTNKNLRANS